MGVNGVGIGLWMLDTETVDADVKSFHEDLVLAILICVGLST